MTPDVFAARVRLAARPPAAPELSVVVPLFDEEANLPTLYRRLSDVLTGTGLNYELLFVDDGSRDRTPTLLADLAAADPRVTAAHLSRNFGHQPAVSAGLDLARGRAVVVMDGDLQDPPELLPRLIEAWRGGADVVYAVRGRRKEGPGLRLAYWAFYRLLRAVSDLPIPLDAGDFCLMDRRVVDAVRRMPERDRFVRGLRAYAGFRQVGVEYDRDARFAGRPKYTVRKLVGLAAGGLVGFSSFPLRAVLAGGLGLSTAGLAAAVATVADAVRRADDPRGWAVTAAVGLLATGLQLTAAGVVGEYVRRIFLEVKGRPPYLLRDVRRQQQDAPDYHPRSAG